MNKITKIAIAVPLACLGIYVMFSAGDSLEARREADKGAKFDLTNPNRSLEAMLHSLSEVDQDALTRSLTIAYGACGAWITGSALVSDEAGQCLEKRIHNKNAEHIVTQVYNLLSPHGLNYTKMPTYTKPIITTHKGMPTIYSEEWSKVWGQWLPNPIAYRNGMENDYLSVGRALEQASKAAQEQAIPTPLATEATPNETVSTRDPEMISLNECLKDIPKEVEEELQALCYRDEVARLDDQLNKEYQRAMKLLSPAEGKDLKSKQRAWLEKRDNTCTGDPDSLSVQKCLDGLYRTRVQELKRL